ncbi:MAG TPA: methionine--tRNA ligase [Nitrospiraceae bacterium]|nr:methionine--tRNA ligase [Nitrospiraceae bacterium]
MSKTFYITTPIYYVNDVPHIGHAYTTVAADVLARIRRLTGHEVFFLTGLDEHGQKVQQAAQKAGIDPQAYCDRLAPQFQTLWKRLNISNDDFVRTTEPRHTTVVQKILQDLYEKGEIYQAAYTGWYCTFDERFWTEKDVVDGVCPDCKRPVEQLSEKNYFFRMGQYQEWLKSYIAEHPDFIKPRSRRNEVLGFLQQPLGDLSISRPKSRLTWGVELPFDKDYVTYVWFDALVNYISIPGYSTDPRRFSHFWPADYHLIGKDILTTHSVYWSTMLKAMGLELPRTIFAHGWWTVNGEKMSKSRGNVVDPNVMAERFGVDAFRYFLLREVPFGHDGDFSIDALIGRINSDLANGLGNLLNRTLVLIERFSKGIIPEPSSSGDTDLERQLRQLVEPLPAKVVETCVTDVEFNRALELVWEVVQAGNQYVDKSTPWTLAKKPEDRLRLETVLYHAAETLRFLCLVLYPFMPQTAEEMKRQLGLMLNFAKPLLSSDISWGGLLPGTEIAKALPLFPRIDVTKTQGEMRVNEQTATDSQPAPQSSSGMTLSSGSSPAGEVPQITIEDFQKIQLKVATVLAAERVPKSEKLLKLRVDLGTEQRQIVAGIGKKYEPEPLIGKKIVIVANLKPAKLMGIESQGMVLAAGDTEVRGLVTLMDDAEPGTKVK